MIVPADFWIKLLPSNVKPESAAAGRHKYCRKVLDLLKKKHPDLFTGKIGAKLSIDEAQALVDILQKNTPGDIFKDRVRYLVLGLEHGSLELNWDVAIPPPPVVIPRDKPRFNHETMAELPVIYSIEEAFLVELGHPPPETITNRIGQLLLSAVLYGGLFHMRWLSPWVEALSHVDCEKNVLWMDLLFTYEHEERERAAKRLRGCKTNEPDFKDGKTSWEIRRRWFADPLSNALILRWLKHFPGDQISARPIPELRTKPYEISPLTALANYICHLLKIPIRETDFYVQTLLRASSTRLGLKVPSFLVAYAEGKNKSVSLKPITWERLLTGKVPYISPELVLANNPLAAVDKQLEIQPATRPAPMVEQEKLLKSLLHIILPSGKSRKRIVSEAKSELQTYYYFNKERMCQSLALLTFWSIDLLTHYAQKDLILGRIRSSIKAKSVHTYLNTIGRRLVAASGQLEILTLESDEYHDLYREVIDSCKTDKLKSKAGKRLRGFHEFLVCRFGAPTVDFSDLMVKSGPAELNVDANLISFTDFENMKLVLCRNYSKASRLRKIQTLISILGFRCGLRRREALKLRIIDLLGETEPEILVRSNRYAYVKSGESVRRLPLHVLLEEEELKQLLAWRWDRKIEDEGVISSSLLFCREKEPTELLSEHLIFPQIEQAMRQVTADPTLTFHHLRHSFATLLSMRLIRNFNADERKNFHFLKHELFEPTACDLLRKSLLGNMTHGRQTLYAVAQLSGHAGPEVTILHYIHLCDWLLGIEVARPESQPKLDAARISAITDIPRHILYYDKTCIGTDDWYISQYLEHLTVPNAYRPSTDLRRPNLNIIPEKKPALKEAETTLWRLVAVVIRERQLAKLPYETLAARSGFAEADIRKWCANAARLAAMKTRRLKPRHINLASLKQDPKEKLSKLKQLYRAPIKRVTDCLFPIPPDIPADKKMAMNVLNAFHNAKGSQRKKMCEGVVTFINTFFVTGSGVLCKTMADARKYLRFLALLDIPQRQIRVLLELPKTVRRSAADELKILVSGLGVPPECIRVRDQYLGEEFRVRKLSINVLNTPVGPAEYKYQIKRSNGFRYAMYMLAIMNNLVD